MDTNAQLWYIIREYITNAEVIILDVLFIELILPLFSLSPLLLALSWKTAFIFWNPIAFNSCLYFTSLTSVLRDFEDKEVGGKSNFRADYSTCQFRELLILAAHSAYVSFTKHSQSQAQIKKEGCGRLTSHVKIVELWWIIWILKNKAEWIHSYRGFI